MSSKQEDIMEDDYMPFGESFKDSLIHAFVDKTMFKTLCTSFIVILWLQSAFVNSLIGSVGAPQIGMLVLMMLDTGLGVAKGVYKKTFSITKMRRTAGKWTAYFVLVVAGHQLVVINIGIFEWVDLAIPSFIGITEFVSIVKNMRAMGARIPMPQDLLKFWTNIKNGQFGEKEKENED